MAIMPKTTWSDVAKKLEACLADTSTWMSANVLKLNEERTELIIFNPKHQVVINEELRLQVGNNTDSVASSVKNFGVYFALRESCSSSSVRELPIRFGLVADEHHDWLIAEFQDYQLTPDDEMPLYSADSRVDTFWAEMAKKKTLRGEMRFPHLAQLMTTLSVIPPQEFW